MRSFSISVLLLSATAMSARAECVASAPSLPPAAACAPVPTFTVGPEVRAPYGCAEARVFFVDFPVHGAAPSAGFGAELAARVSPALTELGAALCRDAACDPACHAASGFEALVAPVFDPDPTSPVARRHDGHRRHWRVSVTQVETGEIVTVAPEAHCAVVDALRTAAVEAAVALGVDPTTRSALRVGREACAVAPMGYGAACGVEALADAPWSENDGTPDVTVALVDTGVDGAWAGSLDVGFEVDGVLTASLPGSAGLHLHGTAMAELIRRVASPRAAELLSFRVMSEDGVGVVADAARAVDAAVGSAPGPVVVNLSLGWMPERARPRRLEGLDCSTVEDDIGETMRYALAVAADADTPSRPVVVVAAAGNRPLSGEDAHAFAVEPTTGLDPWTLDWWTTGQPTTREPMLMPAQYARLDGGVVAVGAVDGADRRGALSVMPPAAEPHLTAPGQFVPLKALDSMTGGTMSTLSGSSLAAAYTSAALARALDALHDRGAVEPTLPLLTGAEVAALVYLVAQDVGRLGAAGHPIRRVSVERLDTLLACEALSEVLGCVADYAADRGALLSHCGWATSTCGLAPSPPCSAAPASGADCTQPIEMSVTPADADPTRWSDLAHAVMTFGDPLSGGVPDRIHQALAGGVGPSPDIPPCSDCLAHFASGAQQVSLWMKMSTQYPSATVFYSPKLAVYDANGAKAVIDIDIGTTVLSPGDTQWVTGQGVPTTMGPVVTAVLLMTVQQPSKPPVVRPSDVAVY